MDPHAPWLQHTVDDLEILNDVVGCVNEEAGDDCVKAALVLWPGIHLLHTRAHVAAAHQSLGVRPSNRLLSGASLICY